MSGFVHGLVARGAGLAPPAPPPRPASRFLPPAEAVPQPAPEVVQAEVTTPALESPSKAPVQAAREATVARVATPPAGSEPASDRLAREPSATAAPVAIQHQVPAVPQPPVVVIAHTPARQAAERATPSPVAAAAPEPRESAVVVEQPRAERGEASSSPPAPRAEPAPPAPAADVAGPPQELPATAAPPTPLRPPDPSLAAAAAPQPSPQPAPPPAPSRPARPRNAERTTLVPQPPRRDPPPPAFREPDPEPAIEVRIGRIEVRPPRAPEPPPPQQRPAPRPERGFDDFALARRGLDRRWY
jgi:hypothetical protein